MKKENFAIDHDFLVLSWRGWMRDPKGLIHILSLQNQPNIIGESYLFFSSNEKRFLLKEAKQSKSTLKFKKKL